MSKDKNIIVVSSEPRIVKPEPAVVVVRSVEEVAQAIMQAGPEFGKIHKGHARDLFLPFRKVR